MKLVVPYIDELRPADARLVKLAEFLGIECELLPLPRPVSHFASYLESAVPGGQSCFVANPGVLKEWVEADGLPPELSSFLTSHFPRLFVHAVGQESFDQDLVSALSGGHLSGVEGLRNPDASYDISPDSRDICEAFAGLSFGPANPGNDRVFIGHNGPAARRLISIDGDAFMAIVSRGECEVIFIGSEDVADLDAEVDGEWIAEYFSRFLPYAMALRHIFREECWRASEQFASVIVDDPLLRLNYGFLNFESLLDLMKRHNFQTTIAFIPYNFRRSSSRITRMFRENSTRFALCFHGNDHTGAEFAATDEVLLNTMLHTAEQRMKSHGEMTKLHCDRVMVFPQGQFSVEAMTALRSCNFEAAVNTVPHPRQQQVKLTLAELARPAVFRYADFPLFLRKNSVRTQTLDIAFNLFFGKPILIVEHHNIFERPQPLIDAIDRINAAAPEIRWSDLGTALSGSILSRREPDGSCRVLASARTVRVSNTTDSLRHFSIEWNQLEDAARVESVLRNEAAYHRFQIDEKAVRVSADLEPGRSEVFSLVFRSSDAGISRFGLRHSARAFVRRRLSEIRDNYLSKNPSVLSAAKSLQRRLHR